MMTESEFSKLALKLQDIFSADIAHLYMAVEKCVQMGYKRPQKAVLMIDAELNNALEKSSAYISVNEAKRLKVIIGHYHWLNLAPEQQFLYIQKAQEMIEKGQFN